MAYSAHGDLCMDKVLVGAHCATAVPQYERGHGGLPCPHDMGGFVQKAKQGAGRGGGRGLRTMQAVTLLPLLPHSQACPLQRVLTGQHVSLQDDSVSRVRIGLKITNANSGPRRHKCVTDDATLGYIMTQVRGPSIYEVAEAFARCNRSTPDAINLLRKGTDGPTLMYVLLVL